MQGEDDRNATEEENEDAEEDEAVDRDDVVVDKGRPGADGAEPHEDGKVEEHVDGGLEGVVESFEAEPVTVGLLVFQSPLVENCSEEGLGEKMYSSVKTLPAMKQASTSSLPIIPQVPTMNN